MKSAYRIQEFAELAGVTVKALRHYDRLGLLKPRRTDAGYRLYSHPDLERLEQILALKFLGLPLRQIRAVLDSADLALPDALRIQLRALEEKQRHLGRAIRAIQAAEQALQPGKPADPALLKPIIEAIDMHDSIEVMKKYFSEEAWLKQKPRYEQGPSPAWQHLYRQAGALLHESPSSEPATALAERWIEQMEADYGGDLDIMIGRARAWEDREHWPPALKREIAEFHLEEVHAFMDKAVLARRKAHPDEVFWIRRDPRARASVAWHELHLEVHAALEAADGASKVVGAHWVEYANRATRVPPDVQARSIRAWEERQQQHRRDFTELYADAALLREHPSGECAEELASRWMELWDQCLCGELSIRTALRETWTGSHRAEIAEALGRALAAPLQKYFTEEAWAMLVARGKQISSAARQQAAFARIALYREAECALAKDPASETAQALAARWTALLQSAAAGDAGIAQGLRAAWADRSHWPAALRRHVASLHLMDAETFERVETFFEKAAQ